LWCTFPLQDLYSCKKDKCSASDKTVPGPGGAAGPGGQTVKKDPKVAPGGPGGPGGKDVKKETRGGPAGPGGKG